MLTQYVSNCQFFAWREFRRRYALWKAAGYPKHARPFVTQLPSNSEPHQVLHAQVGGMGLPTLEFVPVHRKDVPWWLAWTRFRFLGRVRPVDFPRTEPSQHGDL
jgi:hypothetical protein